MTSGAKTAAILFGAAVLAFACATPNTTRDRAMDPSMPGGSCSWTVEERRNGCVVHTVEVARERRVGDAPGTLNATEGSGRRDLLCAEQMIACGVQVTCICPTSSDAGTR